MSTAVGLPLLLRNHVHHFEDSVIIGVGGRDGQLVYSRPSSVSLAGGQLVTFTFLLLIRWTSSDLHLPCVDQVDK